MAGEFYRPRFNGSAALLMQHLIENDRLTDEDVVHYSKAAPSA